LRPHTYSTLFGLLAATGIWDTLAWRVPIGTWGARHS
jgi:hypothetical protein